MRFERSILLVLFVDKESSRLGLMAMYLVDKATRFLARLLGQLGKYADTSASCPAFAIQVTAKTTIACSVLPFLPDFYSHSVRAFISAANSSTNIVS